MLALLAFAGGFGLIWWLGKKDRKTRNIIGSVVAVLGVLLALSGILLPGIFLVLGGAGLAYGVPLGRRS